MFKVAILTISDRGSKGEREDSSGPLIKEMVKDLPAEVIHYEIIPDEKEKIIEALREECRPIEGRLDSHYRRNRPEPTRCDTRCHIRSD